MKLEKILKAGIAGIIITIIFGTIFVAVHQNYRQTANDPQIQLAETIQTLLDSGTSPDLLVSPQKSNLKVTLAPFIIIYDTKGSPVVSSGLLNGSIPKPPQGVFDSTKANGSDWLTWQPEPGVRFALVMRSYKGGFILAARSLREIEKREHLLTLDIAFGWLCSMILLALFFGVKMYFKKLLK